MKGRQMVVGVVFVKARLGLIVAALLLSGAAACGGVKVFKGEINIHACSVVNEADAAAILGGPVTPAARAYLQTDPDSGSGPGIGLCVYELQADDSAELVVSVGGKAVENLESWDAGTRLPGIGKAAMWDALSPHGVETETISKQGVESYWEIGVPGTPPEQIIERAKPVLSRVQGRLDNALPGTDAPEGRTAPPVDVCALVSEEDRTATLGAPGERRTLEAVGGRYGGGWACVYRVDVPEREPYDVLGVWLSRDVATKEQMAAHQAKGTVVPRLGSFAYWKGRETRYNNLGGTVHVLTSRGQHFSVSVVLQDASREQPEAIRIARNLLARL